MKHVQSSDRTTLLLDYAWLPIGVLTARACFKHFIRGRVVGLDKDRNQFGFNDWYDYANLHKDQPCIASTNEIWTLPTVAIVTERFFRRRRNKSYSFKELCVFYDHTCQICFDKFPKQQLSIEHVDPKSNGGTNFIQNKTITCRKCNSKKGSQFPYYDKDGKMLRGTKIPHNYIFIDRSVIRPEWDDLVWVSGTNKEL